MNVYLVLGVTSTSNELLLQIGDNIGNNVTGLVALVLCSIGTALPDRAL